MPRVTIGDLLLRVVEAGCVVAETTQHEHGQETYEFREAVLRLRQAVAAYRAATVEAQPQTPAKLFA